MKTGLNRDVTWMVLGKAILLLLFIILCSIGAANLSYRIAGWIL